MHSPASIFIVRHGQTVWNEQGLYQGSLNSPLTFAGRDQARRAAQFLLSRRIARIYASPLPRAWETALVLRNVLHCPLDVAEEFREMNFGVFEGEQKTVIAGKFAAFFEERKRDKLRTAYPGGESYEDVHARVLHVALAIAGRNEGNVAIVGHESVNRMIRGVIEGLSPQEAVHLRQKNNEIVEYRLDTRTESVVEV